MPHDRNGNILNVGDLVVVPCRVKAIHLTEDFCNVDLETVQGMPPLDTRNNLTLNSRQTLKALDEIQEALYRVRAADPTET